MLSEDFVTIKRMPLFAELDEERDADLIRQIQVKAVSAGDFIFHEGEAGDQLFVIESGEVEIVRIEGEMSEEVAFLQPGDVFGELGVLGQKTRNASARAFSDSKILILDRETTAKLAKILPNFDTLVGTRFMERSKANEEIEYQKPTHE